MPCKHTARYVIVETTYDAPEDDKYGEIGAILEICEIEIYGIFFMKLLYYQFFFFFFRFLKFLVNDNYRYDGLQN